MRKTLQFILLAGILIGLPLFAWYYLTKGTQMRKDAMADLQPKGLIGNFQSVASNDSVFFSDSFKGSKWLIGVIGADSSRASHVELLKALYKQAREEFTPKIFALVGLYSGELFPDMNAQFKFPEDGFWTTSYMAANHVYVFAQDAFEIPESLKNKDVLILLDEQGQIRNYYLLEDPVQVKLMVRQVPVFLSLK